MDQDFTHLTEVTNSQVTKEQLERIYTRYRFASEYCGDKDVLEVACGTGQGLGYLAKSARSVVGGDVTDNMVQIARQHYGERLTIDQIDAHALPYESNSFDVIILYEAIYYLSDPATFIKESKRVLRDEGTIIICTANKDWSGFCPSPNSFNYFSVPELKALLEERGFQVKMFADCPAKGGGITSTITSLIRQFVVKFNLMPKNMKGKEKYKRLFYGKLIALAPEIDDAVAEYSQPVPISTAVNNSDFKVIFSVGKLGEK